MSRAFTIAAKELRTYLVSPVAWVVAAGYLLITGYMFSTAALRYSDLSFQVMAYQGDPSFLNVNQMVLAPLFFNSGIVLLFFVPLVTMRLLAEEKKARTAQLLFTSPVRLGEIVAGKFAAALALLSLVVLLTLYMPLAIASFVGTQGGGVDWGPVLTSYLGLVLLAAAFVSVGLFASSLTENQIVAAVVTFGILLLLWLLGWSAQLSGGLAELLGQLSAITHLEGFVQGAVELKDVAYYLSLAALGLFLTHRVLDSNRWR